MTRRALLSGAPPAVVAACVGCAPERSDLRTETEQLARDLALFQSGNLIKELRPGGYLRILALPLLDSSLATVAPDAECIAWIQGEELSRGIATRFRVAVLNGIRPLRTVPYTWRRPTGLAISSGASHIALSLAPGGDRRVLVVNGETGTLEHDLSGLVRPIAGDIERLVITADGTRLAIGSREAFLVADVLSQRQLLTRRGRFPALAPDGSALAFVDDNRRLVVKNLLTGAETYPLKGWRTYGLARWSPNGRFVLAGTGFPLTWWLKLVAVDTRTGGYAKQGYLLEPDYGSYLEWISQRMVRVLESFGHHREILE